jgi:N6-adenosine-specific RNA methylase IME4
VGRAVEQGRSAEAHYDTMDLDSIKVLPVVDWAADDCALFLWAINSMLPQALAVIEAWGFVYKTVAFTWAKRSSRDNAWHFGLGYWTRQNTESCLLATRGHPARHSRAVPQLLIAPRRLHSQKPEEVHERIERLCLGPYLELFARGQRPG